MITRAPTGYDANLQWNAVPGAAGYRIFWREAWGTGLAARPAASATSPTLLLPNMQIDDYVFGVAVDRRRRSRELRHGVRHAVPHRGAVKTAGYSKTERPGLGL